MPASYTKARMKPAYWLRAFMAALNELEKESITKTDADWTNFMEKVIVRAAKKTKCYAAMRRVHIKDDEYSGEYLNVDALFFDLPAYDDWESKNWDPPVLPSVAVELENDYGLEKITYCLWKLLCVRTHLRVLVCYQGGSDKIEPPRARLEQVILKRGLMEGDPGSLLLIIGDDSQTDDSEWSVYFNIFEWRGSCLKTLKS